MTYLIVRSEQFGFVEPCSAFVWDFIGIKNDGVFSAQALALIGRGELRGNQKDMIKPLLVEE